MATANFPKTAEPFSPAMIQSTIVLDHELAERLRQERADSGADRWDEVLEGVYMMRPLADDEHQGLETRLTSIFTFCIDFQQLGITRAGVNVSDRVDGWTHNFRTN